ncbi:uncharacterized protein L969DRAFT_53955 [Mixia osmundae IAM 14324]|uniref:Uncharacterized protein n=1 Tax=Mixia osmundae (strain CBS 9802 / IAM 14324 / JCM 22182 / KY 12970) TaxID=764103 RepID=G7E2G1_MIXOS|nr:uncharacterized protein L969DRAFT_53955 [Mixia osmundae IAM 14324]KEI36891.1 hypothetical protein L969DRAFT_53955 [Mixia osmundae IAM 14324]GAA97021.1 hypothetical protein E5Q_03696 [Mixia osmundae IAM 14324]
MSSLAASRRRTSSGASNHQPGTSSDRLRQHVASYGSLAPAPNHSSLLLASSRRAPSSERGRHLTREAQLIKESQEESETLRADTLSPVSSRPQSHHTQGEDDFQDLPSFGTFRIIHQTLGVALSAIIFCGLALPPLFGWPPRGSSKRQFYYPLLPQFVQLAIGATAWLATEGLRKPLLRALTFDSPATVPHKQSQRAMTWLCQALPLVGHTVCLELFRLFAIWLGFNLSSSVDRDKDKHEHPPNSFFRAYYLGLGWALAELIIKTLDFLRAVDLYEDVLPADDEEVYWEQIEPEQTAATPGAAQRTTSPRFELVDGSVDEWDLDLNVRASKRRAIGAAFGVHLYELPLMLIMLWRLDSALLALAFTIALSLPFSPVPHVFTAPLSIMWPAVAILHIILSIIWSLHVPKLGIAAVSYMTLIISLIAYFGALASYGALA